MLTNDFMRMHNLCSRMILCNITFRDVEWNVYSKWSHAITPMMSSQQNSCSWWCRRDSLVFVRSFMMCRTCSRYDVASRCVLATSWNHKLCFTSFSHESVPRGASSPRRSHELTSPLHANERNLDALSSYVASRSYESVGHFNHLRDWKRNAIMHSRSWIDSGRVNSSASKSSRRHCNKRVAIPPSSLPRLTHVRSDLHRVPRPSSSSLTLQTHIHWKLAFPLENQGKSPCSLFTHFHNF